MSRTIPQLFQDSVANFPDNIFILEKKSDQYEGTTYKELSRQVKQLTAALHDYGIQKGDRISLIAEGRNDWVISELAMLHLGAINVPLSVKILEPEEVKFRIKHSESRMIICSGNQLKKVRQVIRELPLVEKVIILDEQGSYEPKEVCLKDFISGYENYFTEKQPSFEEIWQQVEEGDCATISYTSGTTAEPKGIMLSHRNYTANVEQSGGMFEIPAHYSSLLILPWDHSFAHTVGIYPLMKNGGSIGSVQVGKTANETLRNIPVNIKEFKPVFLLSAPALAKNFKKNIEKNIRQKGKFTEFLFNWAVGNAKKYHRLGYDRGKGLSFLRKPLIWLHDKIIFSKIREAFGGKLEFMVGGAALLDVEIQKFFCAIGMPMYQGYGLTEAAPVISSNTLEKHKFGSSGIIAPGLECKILDGEGKEVPAGQKGEIVVKGENVMMGYWKNEEATKETIKNGWLHTGDLGYLDEDGFLYVLGRFKSLLISEDGEKYSPEGIEEAIIDKSPFIDQCMLYNDHKPYTVALLVLNAEFIKRFIQDEGIDLKTESGKEHLLNSIKAEILKFYNEGEFGGMFPERWLPSAFAVLKEGFTEQNRLMNSTMKIVRGKITDHYQEHLDYLYTPEGKNVTNPRNLEALQVENPEGFIS